MRVQQSQRKLPRQKITTEALHTIVLREKAVIAVRDRLYVIKITIKFNMESCNYLI